ncbi:MAG TPA: FtsK/SpoIIIE domain-containing protein, partial [Alphaproteobacteria bacterium]
NLEYNAVERIFVAIKAEMDRRAAILAKAGASDLVEYRKKVIPTLKPDSPFPDTFPHLFVVVDEFAEMIQANPDYKLQFEQITRLGRAFGVTLILATQRPSGAVTDQMKANMKFRICLRMETPDDSKELLNKTDAARLPQIAGRGYLQAGSETLTEVQVAWSGAPYTDDQPDPQYPTEIVLEALGTSEKPRSTLTWLVGALGAEAKRLNIPKQRKPWPDPLPAELPLNRPVDASYLPDVPEDKTVLAPAIAAWVDAASKKPEQAASLWKPFDWKSPLPLKAVIGVMDDPYHSIQRLFTIDVAADPIAVFGASGRGKSTLIKSLVLALGARHSPRDFHFYAIDFGRGGLRSLRNLPHCGAVIDTVTPDRIEALFRMVRGMMNERQERLANYPSREDYNAQKLDNPDTLLPSALVAIDNFNEFKENFEYLLPDLISLVRDGRQFGIHFVITATAPGELPAKLYNVLGQRITFTLPDPTMYADIVGRTSISLPNLPGRGLAVLDGQPLEFHLGVPVIEGEKDPYARLTERMLAAWEAVGGKRPSAEIPRAITLLEMYQRLEGRRTDLIGDLGIADQWKRSMKPENQEWLSGALAMVSSKEVRQLVYSAKPGGDGVHGMVAGTTGSGKSELLQTLIAGLAIKYDPRIINFVLVDYKGGATIEPFRGLPHVVDMATNLEGNAVDRIFVAIKAEMDRRSEILAKAGVADLVDYRKKVIPTLKPDSPFPDTFPHLFVIVDEFAEMIQANPDYKLQFEQITRLGRAFGVTLILATQRPSGAVTDQMKANMKFRMCLRVETTDDSREMLGRNDAATLPGIPGRGYLQVGGGPVSEFQAAYSGASYDVSRPDPAYSADEILEVLEKQNDPPRSFLGWLVGALAAESRRQGIARQFKPWPNPLPAVLPLNGPLDATYIFKDAAIPSVVLAPAVQKWMEAADSKSLWEPYDWKKGPMPVEAMMGLIDNPYLAQQRLLTVDVAGDPLLVLGASGRGKTTFLKSLVVCLAAQHSPAELHFYVLDFGRGGL